jgi:peptidoglycan/LPS O-acetylase OafA/YrhL
MSPADYPREMHAVATLVGADLAEARRPARRWIYRPELDGLRAQAMLAVVGFHYLPDHVPGGYLGVTVFFGLSGSLITGLLTTEQRNHGRIDLRAFYARRALRLYPGLIAVVAGVLITAAITGHAGIPDSRLYQAAGASLLYINDFALAAGHAAHHFTGWLDATWSLGVEEQFYLPWPVILILALRWMPSATIGRYCAALAIAAGLLTVVLRIWLPYSIVYYSPIGSIMPLLLGCALSFHRPRVPGWLGGAAGIALVALVLAGPAPQSRASWFGAQQLAALAGITLVAYLVGPGWALMRARVLVWLGRRSYGIYLIHAAVFWALVNLLPTARGSEYALIGVPVSIALAAASYRWIEEPFLRRKRRFARADSPPRTGNPNAAAPEVPAHPDPAQSAPVVQDSGPPAGTIGR